MYLTTDNADQGPAAEMANEAIAATRNLARDVKTSGLPTVDLVGHGVRVRVHRDDTDIVVSAISGGWAQWVARFTEHTPSAVVAAAIRAHLTA